MKVYRYICLAALPALLVLSSTVLSADSVGKDIVDSMREAREMEVEPSARDIYMRENYPLAGTPVNGADRTAAAVGSAVWESKERETGSLDSVDPGAE